MRAEIEAMTGPLIQWTNFPNRIDNDESNAALLDYIDAVINAAFQYRAGMFFSELAYNEHKEQLRQEFNKRLLQLSGAK